MVQDRGLRVEGQRLPVVKKLLSRNVERSRGGLASKAHRLLYHPTLGSRVIKKKVRRRRLPVNVRLGLGHRKSPTSCLLSGVEFKRVRERLH